MTKRDQIYTSHKSINIILTIQCLLLYIPSVFVSDVSLYVWKDDLSAWISYCTRGTETSSLPCVFFGASATRRTSWIAFRRTARYIRRVAHPYAIGDVLSGEMFCRTLYYSLLCDICAAFFDPNAYKIKIQIYYDIFHCKLFYSEVNFRYGTSGRTT